MIQYFENGTIRLIKENLRYKKNTVYRVWKWTHNMWILNTRICAKDFNEAYEKYLEQGGALND